MIQLFRAELMKIRRSLIWLVVFAVPLFVAIIFLLGISYSDEPLTWQMLSLGAAGVWSIFLLPMAATIVTALLGQVEHRHNTWSLALTLPHPKWQVFVVKEIVAVLLIAVMGLVLYGLVLLSGVLGGVFNPDAAPMGSLPYAYLGKFMYRIGVAALMLIAVQFYVAMRFGGMALPLIVGVGGTLFSIVTMATSLFGLGFDIAKYLPWVLPMQIMEQHVDATRTAMLIGGGGGIIVFAIIALGLAGKDWK
ncbi:ABC transporter permease [Parvularcula sp. LCG005]|uniref:ABC transporter permease n=1 Tax=Parvularcula sp. LCG005 TaxID=3078805 RepID=UPI0029429EB9|nr:ABC transporter permease [Parvularcula sp. LCG005]WOI54728.1 ABC transporter permease [Parvularcula sp. LCG005]